MTNLKGEQGAPVGSKETVVELLERAKQMLRSRADAEKVSIHDADQLVKALERIRNDRGDSQGS